MCNLCNEILEYEFVELVGSNNTLGKASALVSSYSSSSIDELPPKRLWGRADKTIIVPQSVFQ